MHSELRWPFVAMSRRWAPVAVLLCLAGCAGHEGRTRTARNALDAAEPWRAIDALNDELDVEDASRLPAKMEEDSALLLLDRATVLQQVQRYDWSSRDYQVADKQIELLNFSHQSIDDISRYLFSDESGPYRAPGYEKLMINSLNMLNYLALKNLSGARVEARRFSVQQRYLRDYKQMSEAVGALGNYLAGFIYEMSGRQSEAKIFYKDALRLQGQEAEDAHLPDQQTNNGTCGEPSCGTVLVVVGVGRVPVKYAKRIPIGLALTYASSFLSPHDVSRANYLAGQGLVTWVNFPTLGKPQGSYEQPYIATNGRSVDVDAAVAVDEAAVRAWRQARGAVIASAITRAISRAVAGEVSRRAVGGVAGALISLGGQAALTATDTPDTRSWSTLPARVYLARIQVPAGQHVITIQSRGLRMRQQVTVTNNGWAVAPFMALR